MKGKTRSVGLIVMLIILSAVLTPLQKPSEHAVRSSTGGLFAQETLPGQKPAYDYMSSYLSRNTNPLGLEENQEIMELRNQPAIKWVIRAGWRHSLN